MPVFFLFYKVFIPTPWYLGWVCSRLFGVQCAICVEYVLLVIFSIPYHQSSLSGSGADFIERLISFSGYSWCASCPFGENTWVYVQILIFSAFPKVLRTFPRGCPTSHWSDCSCSALQKKIRIVFPSVSELVINSYEVYWKIFPLTFCPLIMKYQGVIFFVDSLYIFRSACNADIFLLFY